MSPNIGYAYSEVKDNQVRISFRDLRVSFKSAVNLCRYINGRSLDEARRILKDVIELKKAVPYRRFKKNVGHRKSLQGYPAGRYPVKVAKNLLKMLDHAEAMAEDKDLDIERLKIVHLAAQKGPKLKRYFPRAYGRSTPRVEQLVHIELVVEEIGE